MDFFDRTHERQWFVFQSMINSRPALFLLEPEHVPSVPASLHLCRRLRGREEKDEHREVLRILLTFTLSAEQ